MKLILTLFLILVTATFVLTTPASANSPTDILREDVVITATTASDEAQLAGTSRTTEAEDVVMIATEILTSTKDTIATSTHDEGNTNVTNTKAVNGAVYHPGSAILRQYLVSATTPNYSRVGATATRWMSGLHPRL